VDSGYNSCNVLCLKLLGLLKQGYRTFQCCDCCLTVLGLTVLVIGVQINVSCALQQHKLTTHYLCLFKVCWSCAEDCSVDYWEETKRKTSQGRCGGWCRSGQT